MKYFPYSLIAAVNGWEETSSELSSSQAEAAIGDAMRRYHKELDGLRSRVSGPTWDFFRNGGGKQSLHDARLLSFTIGDGLSYVPDGSSPFRLNRQAAEANILFQNYEQTYHYVFRARNIRRTTLTFEADDFYPKRRFGDLYIYELTAADDQNLNLGFLFADGAEITLEFRTLLFRRRRLDRRYELDEIYR